MLQLIADGLIQGALVSLGALGLTLTYSILRFANFTQGELVTGGAYAALMALAGFAGVAQEAGTFAGLSFGWPMLVALLLGMLAMGGLALSIEWLLFGRLRRRGNAITLVIASFGASLALRNLIGFGFGRHRQPLWRGARWFVDRPCREPVGAVGGLGIPASRRLSGHAGGAAVAAAGLARRARVMEGLIAYAVFFLTVAAIYALVCLGLN